MYFRKLSVSGLDDILAFSIEQLEQRPEKYTIESRILAVDNTNSHNVV